MQNKNNSQPNLLGRIYRSPNTGNQQLQQGTPTPLQGNASDSKLGQKVLVAKIPRKKLDNTPEPKQKKPIYVGHYPLGIVKEHNVAAVFFNDKVDEAVISPSLAKTLQMKQVPINVNPNAMSTTDGQGKKKDELSLGQKKTIIQGIRGTKGDKHHGGHEKATLSQDEYLSPFDFIALLRTDPDMADEFCYLNKRENSYDWMIVDFENRNPKEYMTISSRGITHFLDDEATFLTIEEWEREVSMYHRLKNIAFFKDYKIWKNFTVWKHLFRKNMMRDRSQLLNQDLFFLDRHLNSALLWIRKLCIEDMATIDIFKTGFDEPRTLEEFIKEQEEFKSKKLSHLEGMEAAIRETIERSCNTSMQAFKEENRIQNRNEANEGEEPPPLLVGDETNKEMPYTQEATIRTHQRKLRRFIKLVDYLVLEAKMRMLTYSTEKLVQALQLYNKAGKEKVDKKRERTAKAGQPILIVEAWFNETELIYYPSSKKLVRLFEEIVNKGITLICSKHKQFLHENEFAVYAKSGDFNEDPSEELINMHVLIKNHRDQNDLMEYVKQELDTAFNYVEAKADSLVSRLEIYQQHQNLDIEIYAGKDVEEIRQALHRFDNEHKELQKPKEKSDIGLYRLDKKRLLDTIKDCAKKSKEKLELRLPQLNYERARQLVRRVDKLNDKLANPPTNVDDFVVFVRDLNDTIGQQDEIASKVQEINDMSVLVEERKIKVKEDFKSEPMNAVRQAKKLEQRVKMAEESQNANINKFRAELGKDISLINPRIEDLRNLLQDPRLSAIISDVDEVVEFLTELEKKVVELKENGRKYNVYQDELQMEVTPFINIEDVWKEFSINKRLWVSKKEWRDSYKKWTESQFLEIDVEDMALVVEKLGKAAMLCSKELELNEVAKLFKTEVEGFKVVVDVIVSLRGDALKETHWEEIRHLIERDNVPESLFTNREDPALTFKSIVELDLVEYKNKLQDIAVRAIKEKELEKMLFNVQQFWSVAFLTVAPYKDKQDFYILGNNEELITKLDDSLETISSILSSRYVEGIRAKVEKEKEDLRYFQELLDAWMICQKNWMYLEPIFSSADIQKQLSSEYKRFHSVENQWKSTMKNALTKRSASHWAHNEKNQLQSFKKDNENLEKVQKALEDYLENKRQDFPRFFFLSNDELLEILSQAKEPQKIQPHLRKCFENINKLEFDSNIVSAMISAEGERVELKNLKAQGNVEVWLKDLEKNMQETLKVKMERALEALNREDAPTKKEWVKQHNSQLIIAVDSMEWTRITEDFLQSDNVIEDMEKWYESMVAQLQDLTELIRGELTPIERRTIVALVTQDVHYRDIVETLKNDQVDNANDFKWQQQLRFYFRNKICEARQVNATLPYGYEYLGATTRLVITPLTDRCWMTITGALHIQLGAAPAGPAGTGKTESTKDLAKALGRLCVVFNCSEQITVRMMEKLFMGLCATDSWSCLDEFNRINIEVLSVIAQQVRLIKDALHVLKGKMIDEHEVDFGAKRVRLRPNMGIFITMNPGYAGRTELPDNLKVLFRPVAMMVPDYSLIAEIMLYAEGFSDAKDLSRKMTKLYKLASEQLSQQDHYDFGMRAVKSVLVMAGALKRAEPKLSEDIVLIRAMRDSNVPKFLSHDLPLFNAIISDLFPDVDIPNTENAELIGQIREEITKQNLPVVDDFVEKVIQYHETLKVRFGVMLVGPSMAGKSTVFKTLRDSYTMLRQKGSENPDFQGVEFEILNPKAISMGELYGDFDNFTLEWTDGLAARIMREYASKETDEKKWVMFDGPVDALWIENMNTVLDDNMTLCLSNGERVKLKWQMRMLFEVQDLAVASPATVSRCGMVYIDSLVIGNENVIKNFVDNILGPLLPPENIEQILKLFALHFSKTIAHIRKHFNEPIATVDSNLAHSIVKIIEIFLKKGELKPANLNPEGMKRAIDKIFIFAFVWGIGSALNPIFLMKFETFLGSVFQPNDLPRGSVYDSFISYENKPEGEFKEWSTITPEFEFTKEKNYFELIVPTKDTTRYAWFLESSIDILNSVFFTGITGVGKTIIMEETIERLKANGSIDTLTMTFSAKTSSLQAQMTIESKLFPSRKDGLITLKPPAGKKLVVFIDDINMPSKEEYGAQPPIELLRLFQDRKGFFDRQQHFWKDVKDTVLIAAAAPPGGGRSDLTPRFTRHFHMMCLPPTQEESLNQIFKSILSGFLKGYTFKGEVAAIADNVVSATLDIYNKISVELLPTPAKSHYTFNLRDVSKVFQGILLTRPVCVQNTDSMVRIWIHETCRVFFDRLVNDEDRTWFKNNIVTLLFLHFKVDWTAKDVFEDNPIIFADFMKKGVEMDQRTYEEVKEYNRLVKVITEYMDEETNMRLVLFKDAVEHLCRVARILRLLRGHAMLVGLGGSGKKSLTRLASVLAGAGDPIMIEPKKGYKEEVFRQDLFEKMMYKAGVENKTMTFLLPDTHILKESFLEDINNLLNSGEVPNLLKKDEFEKLRATMQDVIKEEGVNKDPYGYFVERVRANLHIVLAMSPVGDKLRNRLRMFPSLVNCCTIDWINPWPEDALLSVAKMSLENLEFEGATPQLRDSLAQMCMFSHITIEQEADRYYKMLKRKVYTTPKGYIDLINSYLHFLKEKYNELNSYKNKLANGLTKLSETNETVKSLEETLTKLQPVLKEKAIEQEALIQKIKIDRVDADRVKEVVGEEERVVNEQAQKIKVLKDDADVILKKAEEILMGAKKSLDTLQRQELAEVKGNQNPLIKFGWQCCAILLYNKEDDETVRRMLADASLINKMKDVDPDRISEDIQKKIKKKLASNSEFTEDKVATKQAAARSIATWVHAVAECTDKSTEVASKQKYVNEMSAQLDSALSALKIKQDQMAVVVKKVTDLETQLHESIKEKERLENEKVLTEERLDRAGKLTTGLADEQVRWKEKVEELKEDVTRLIGDVFISAASVVYYGPFTGSFRSEIVEKWIAKCKELEIPCSDDYTLTKTLGDPVQIREWNIAGLPSDNVSTNNGILVFKTTSWPFMIDPQLQANKWIKSLESRRGRHLVTIKASDNIAKATETCLRMGNPLLIEDMQETLDPALEPLLTKQFTISNNRMMVKIDSQEVEYDPKFFNLYFTTKIANPHFLPEVFIRVSVINFTVTELGLEEQLLADVVSKEMPEKEQLKNELIMSISRNKQSLVEGENRILELLSKSQGLVLDDKELVEKLQASKLTSNEVKKNLVEAEETQKNIDEARSKCKPVATRGSILYFVIADLALIDPMYQFSLSYFSRLFNLVIDTSPKSENFDERINILMNTITETIYLNVCRGLFNSHKQLFSFLVSSAIDRKSGQISGEEWNVFLKGIPLIKSNIQVPAIPPNTKFSQKSWSALCNTQTGIPIYKEVVQSIIQDYPSWEAWLYSQEPFQTNLPLDFNDKLTIFQKLLLIKLLRTEKSLISMNLYVLKTLGQKFFSNVPATMEEVYQDTDQKTPMIFILSPGADPLLNLQRFAKEKQMFDKLHTISLGQGQEGPAEESIKEGRKHGMWILLQNCHLAKSFMPKLERILETLEDAEAVQETNPNFRLFLSSMPCDYFPVSVLQNGVKQTNEPPKGLKANMTRTYNEFSQGKLDECSKGEIWRKILFSFSLFHAIIQERRKFGPLGWNIRYEFNDSDLETSITMLYNMLEGIHEVPWDAIKFMTGQINYGGRVTDDNDRRCLLAILEIYCGEQVLSDEYAFSRSGIYKSPADGSLTSYKSYISNFPDLEDPEVFGMHSNANITFEMTESVLAINTILSIQPRDVGGVEGKTPDEIVDALASELEAKIPPTIKKEQEDKPMRGPQPTYIDSLVVCLSQEVERFNRILKVMRRTISELKKAIKGEVVMSVELDKMYQSLLNNQVPQLWQKVSYPSLKNLASWFEDLIKRVEFFSNWLNKGKPKGFWLSAFFFPQGFLTSVLQNYARKYKTPIDILGFAFDFLEFTEIEKVNMHPEDGCYIYGLYVEGCKFDMKHGRLEDSRPGEMFTEAPVIYFNPTENYSPDPYDYSMPVYKTTLRAGTLSTTGHSTNFIIFVDVPTKQKPEYWTLNGAAFICAMNN